MLEIENYHYADSLEDASLLLKTAPGATIMGGCGYIRLGARKITHAIDLSRLNLDFVHQTDKGIEIGAMTTLRQFETNPLLNSFCDGILSRCVANIVGIQLRNCVTIGGTIGGRYPFSDPITALLALDAAVETYEEGIINLDDLLKRKKFSDIVVKIILPSSSIVAAFESVRKSATDYAILNTCAAKSDTNVRVAVGARPGRAILIDQVTTFLQNQTITPAVAEEAGKIAAEAIDFGDNPRGSKEYRQMICPVLIKRSLLSLIREEPNAA